MMPDSETWAVHGFHDHLLSREDLDRIQIKNYFSWQPHPQQNCVYVGPRTGLVRT